MLVVEGTALASLTVTMPFVADSARSGKLSSSTASEDAEGSAICGADPGCRGAISCEHRRGIQMANRSTRMRDMFSAWWAQTPDTVRRRDGEQEARRSYPERLGLLDFAGETFFERFGLHAQHDKQLAVVDGNIPRQLPFALQRHARCLWI